MPLFDKGGAAFLPENSDRIAAVMSYAIVRGIGFFEALDLLKKARDGYGELAADFELAFQSAVVKEKNKKRK